MSLDDAGAIVTGGTAAFPTRSATPPNCQRPRAKLDLARLVTVEEASAPLPDYMTG